MTVPAMRAVVSSNVSEVGYDSEAEHLFVRFTNGGLYAYAHVSQSLFDRLMAAKSVGSFLRAEITSKPDEFPFTPVPPA